MDSEFSVLERTNMKLGKRSGKGGKSKSSTPVPNSINSPIPGPSKVVRTTTTTTPTMISRPTIMNTTTPATTSTSAITTVSSRGVVLPTMKEKVDAAVADLMDQSNSDQLSSDTISQALFEYNIMSAVSDGGSFKNKRRSGNNSVGFFFTFDMVHTCLLFVYIIVSSLFTTLVALLLNLCQLFVYNSFGSLFTSLSAICLHFHQHFYQLFVYISIIIFYWLGCIRAHCQAVVSYVLNL